MSKLDPENIPRHVAVIPDGNGRWAEARNLPRNQGHRKGVENVREFVRSCSELGIRMLTLYAFSQENWDRPKEEVGLGVVGFQFQSVPVANDCLVMTFESAQRVAEIVMGLGIIGLQLQGAPIAGHCLVVAPE